MNHVTINSIETRVIEKGFHSWAKNKKFQFCIKYTIIWKYFKNFLWLKIHLFENKFWIWSPLYLFSYSSSLLNGWKIFDYWKNFDPSIKNHIQAFHLGDESICFFNPNNFIHHLSNSEISKTKYKFKPSTRGLINFIKLISQWNHWEIGNSSEDFWELKLPNKDSLQEKCTWWN